MQERWFHRHRRKLKSKVKKGRKNTKLSKKNVMKWWSGWRKKRAANKEIPRNIASALNNKKVERWWWWRACNLRQKKKRSIFCWLIQIELCLMQCVSPVDSPSKPKEHKNGCWNISVNLEYLQMNGAISIRFGSFQSQIVSKY